MKKITVSILILTGLVCGVDSANASIASKNYVDTQLVAPLHTASAKLEGSVVTGSLTDASGNLNSSITTTLETTITTDMIAKDAVTNVKIAANAVTNAALAANAVTTGKIAAGAVTTDKIAAGAVDTADIAAGAVTTGKIAANAVDTADIAAGAVTSAKLAANAVDTADIAAGAVTSAKLASGAITGSDVPDSVLLTTKLKLVNASGAAIAATAGDVIVVNKNKALNTKKCSDKQTLMSDSTNGWVCVGVEA